MIWDADISFEGFQKRIEAGMREKHLSYAILR